MKQNLMKLRLQAQKLRMLREKQLKLEKQRLEKQREELLLKKEIRDLKADLGKGIRGKIATYKKLKDSPKGKYYAAKGKVVLSGIRKFINKYGEK